MEPLIVGGAQSKKRDGRIFSAFFFPSFGSLQEGTFLFSRRCDGLDAIKGYWYIKSAALLQSGNRKEVLGMDILSSILVAVAAAA